MSQGVRAAIWLAAIAIISGLIWLILNSANSDTDNGEIGQGSSGNPEAGFPPGNNAQEGGIQTPAAPTRQNKFTASYSGDEAQAINGKALLVSGDEGLLNRLLHSSSIAKRVWEDSLLFEGDVREGAFSFEIQESWLGESVVLISFCTGYAPRVDLLNFGKGVIEIRLERVSPITVKVKDRNGIPIAGAPCWLRADGYDRSSFSSDWVLGLSQICFSTFTYSDEFGVAKFPIAYSGLRNSIQVSPLNTYASRSVNGVSPGSTVSIECGFAFASSGVVREQLTLKPVPNAVVSFLTIIDDEWQTVYSALTDEHGAYRAESLPAESTVVWVLVNKVGYASTQFHLYNPPANSVQRQDFFLEKAVNVEMQVVTAWGTPIPNADTYFRARRFDDGPSAGRTDGKGFLRGKSLLAANRTYALVIGLQDSVWLEVNQLIQPTDNKVVVPGMAQIAEVRLDEEQFPKGTTGQLAWAVLATETNGEITWPLGEKSPILPAGPGRLTLRTESTTLQMQTELAENGDNIVDFRATPAALNFEWLGPNPATVTLYGEGDFLLIDEQEFAPGSIRIPCWEGNFRLTVTHEGGKREIPVTVTAPSVDIGPIGGADTAAIYGRVMGADGPFPGVYVDLDLPGGTIAASSLTDEEGYFRIEGLAPGEYNLFLTGDTMFGPDMPEQRRAIFLKPGEEQGPFALTFLSSADGLHGRVVGEAPAGTASWMMVDGHVEQDLVEPDRSFHLRRPLADTTVGLTTMRRGLVMVTTQQVPAGAQQIEIGVPSREHLLKIVDPQGKPRTDVVVQAFYQGAVLPFQAVPDNGGRLTFRVQRGLDVDLQFRLPDGSVELVYYDDIANHREITLPTSGRTIPVQVQDVQGDPIHGAVAMRYGVGDVMHADGYGLLMLAETEPDWPYQITADGYLGQWITPKEKEVVILQPLLSGLRLDLSGVEERSNIAKVQLTLSGLPEGAAITETLSLPYSGAASVALPPLPECTLRIDLLNSEGEVITQKSFSIHDRGEQLSF